MFQLRPDQIAELGRVHERTFVSRLIDLLRECFPDAHHITNEELVNGVAKQVAKARSYGLENEDEIAFYVVTAWQLGQDFDTFFPAAKFMLNSNDYTPSEKRDWLEAWTVEMFQELQGGD